MMMHPRLKLNESLALGGGERDGLSLVLSKIKMDLNGCHPLPN